MRTNIPPIAAPITADVGREEDPDVDIWPCPPGTEETVDWPAKKKNIKACKRNLEFLSSPNRYMAWDKYGNWRKSMLYKYIKYKIYLFVGWVVGVVWAGVYVRVSRWQRSYVYDYIYNVCIDVFVGEEYVWNVLGVVADVPWPWSICMCLCISKLNRLYVFVHYRMCFID